MTEDRKETSQDEVLEEMSEVGNPAEDTGDSTEANKQLAAKEAELQEYIGRLQRLQADFENFRKRNQKEREELAKYGAERLVCSLLPVLDNFERALTATGEESSLKTGVEMIYRQLSEVLANEGLACIEAVGKEFDPNMHQAVMRVEAQEHGDNEVVEELQKGYLLKEKVIRPSMVKVAQN